MMFAMDPRTLAIASDIVGGALTLLSITLWLTGQMYPGFGRWTLARTLAAVTTLVSIRSGFWPDWVVTTIIGAVVICDHILMLEACREFTGMRTRIRWVTIGGACLFPVLVYTVAGLHMTGTFFLLVNLFGGAIFAACAWTLLLHDGHSASEAGRLITGSCFAAQALIYGVYAGSYVTHIKVVVVGPYQLNTLYLLFVTLWLIGINFGFILMHYERLLKDRAEQAALTERANGELRQMEERSQSMVHRARIEQEKAILEGQLAQAQKMEALGQLSGRVAHDFNNLLTVINGYSDNLSKQLAGQPALQRRADLIHKAGVSAKGITEQLLAFSQKRLAEPVRLDLNAVLNDSREILEQLVGPRVTLRFDLAEDLSSIQATVASCQQVLTNLAANARDAMPEGGEILIRTWNEKVENAARPGLYVVMAVHDSGEGIPPEHLKKIFEPFFTTKQEGKGTGLGLATVYGILKQRGGWVDVESRVGLGTNFRVYYPALKEAAARPAPGAETPISRGAARWTNQGQPGSLTILVADDDAAIVELCSDMLRSRGCTVLSAASGSDALQVSRDYRGQIDLLVSDVVMPGLSGPALAERLRCDRPGLAVLFMTGYAVETIQRGPRTSVIAKPFDEQGFLEAVGALAAANAAPPETGKYITANEQPTESPRYKFG